MKMNAVGLSLTALLLLVSPLAIANEYVPPPTGPYQSSVIINSVEKNSVQQPQVYKFPTEDLIHQDSMQTQTQSTVEKGSQSFPGSADKGLQAEMPPETDQGFIQGAPTAGYETQALEPGPRNMPPAANYPPYNNPWSIGQQSQFPQYHQGQLPYQGGTWPTAPYPYAQGGYVNPYMYDYSNRYNSMDSPYNSMPTPWSVMPMQQFFSGR